MNDINRVVTNEELKQMLEVAIDRILTATQEIDYIVECVRHKHFGSPLIGKIESTYRDIEQQSGLLLSYLTILIPKERSHNG